MFCYACVAKHVQTFHKCPITQLPSSTKQLVRIMTWRVFFFFSVFCSFQNKKKTSIRNDPFQKKCSTTCSVQTCPYSSENNELLETFEAWYFVCSPQSVNSVSRIFRSNFQCLCVAWACQYQPINNMNSTPPYNAMVSFRGFCFHFFFNKLFFTF